MYYLDALKEQQGGFNFDFCQRNKVLQEKKIVSAPLMTKTGTTIVGLIFKDGICLGADTRATAGEIVADKNCEKIHYLAPNMYCCGAGTAADNQWVTCTMSSQLHLQRLNTGRQSRVSTVVTRLSDQLFKYQGHIGAALIIGGYDCTGSHLCVLSPYGNFSYLPFATMGSGSLAAIAIFEAKYNDNLNEQQAKDLVVEAVEAGIIHDLGSGSNVDICVIKKDKTEFFRNLKSDNKKMCKPYPYQFPLNNTPFLKQLNIKIEKIEIKDKNEEKMMIEK